MGRHRRSRCCSRLSLLKVRSNERILTIRRYSEIIPPANTTCHALAGTTSTAVVAAQLQLRCVKELTPLDMLDMYWGAADNTGHRIWLGARAFIEVRTTHGACRKPCNPQRATANSIPLFRPLSLSTFCPLPVPPSGSRTGVLDPLSRIAQLLSWAAEPGSAAWHWHPSARGP